MVEISESATDEFERFDADDVDGHDHFGGFIHVQSVFNPWLESDERILRGPFETSAGRRDGWNSAGHRGGANDVLAVAT
jgi:hypothetical protein